MDGFLVETTGQFKRGMDIAHDGLASLFAGHAAPEVCHHFHAYGPAGVILEWYDSFFRDPLYISRAVPEEAVKSFCVLVGSQYREGTSGAS
jgi:hypothetical protein